MKTKARIAALFYLAVFVTGTGALFSENLIVPNNPAAP